MCVIASGLLATHDFNEGTYADSSELRREVGRIYRLIEEMAHAEADALERVCIRRDRLASKKLVDP